MAEALRGQTIICIAHDWNGDPTSKTHIMRILARDNRVIWVNSIGYRRPRLTWRDARRLASKLRRGVTPPREAQPNLVVVDPLTVPLPGVAAVDRLNARLLGARLTRLCAGSAPILWTFLPNVTRLAGRLGERLLVYHCVDEYASFANVPSAALARAERELVRRADVVLASAERLADERRGLNPETHFVSHGVDLEHFAAALDPATAVPADAARLPRPVVGFFGLLADWVDLDLVRALANRRPAWSFVLLGKTTTDTEALRGAPNVHLLGQKPYATLPAYCRGFDVALLPFRMNRLTVRANPLKLREYLAAGLPVVSSPLPEVARYDGLVRLAEGPDAFLAALEHALRDRSPAADRHRADAMRSESWAARVAEMTAIVASHLARRRRVEPAA